CPPLPVAPARAWGLLKLPGRHRGPVGNLRSGQQSVETAQYHTPLAPPTRPLPTAPAVAGPAPTLAWLLPGQARTSNSARLAPRQRYCPRPATPPHVPHGDRRW